MTEIPNQILTLFHDVVLSLLHEHVYLYSCTKTNTYLYSQNRCYDCYPFVCVSWLMAQWCKKKHYLYTWTYLASVESQKGVITIQWCSNENQKGATGCCTKPRAIAPFWFSMEHPSIALMPFWFSADDMYTLYTYIQTKIS